MRVLAIDTVTEMCSVALSVDGECIERQEKAINRHSAIVLGMVDELLNEAGLGLAQLDLVVNDVGPGSFTGIRIGMGVAQGLAYGADLPLLGVDALATLAQAVTGDTKSEILAAIDARMGQVYYARYTHDEDRLVRVGELLLSDPADVRGGQAPVFGVGSGWDAYTDRLLQNLDVEQYLLERFPLAGYGLEIGLEMDRSNWVEAGALLPVYLRNDVAKVSNKSLV